MIKATIDECDFETFKIKVEKLQKIAEKLHLEIPQYRVVEERFAPHPTIPKMMYKVIDLEIDDVNVTFADWKVVCHIRRVSKDLKIQGKVIGNAFYYPLEELPESCYEKAPTLCEHCGKNISNRLLTFILRNEKTGEYKQVGSTCVKNFVSDYRNITSIINFLNEYTNYMNDVPRSGDVSRMRLYIPVKDVLRLAVDILQKSGWVSKTDYSIYHAEPSVIKLHRRILDNKWECETEVKDETLDEIIKYSENRLIELSEKTQLTGSDNYMRNCALQIINPSMEITEECMGYLLIGARSYFQQFVRKPSKNEYYGNEGDEFHDKFIVTNVRPIENDFGTSLLVTMVNHDGYGFKTFANIETKFAQFILNRPADFVFESDVKIKKHEEFKGSRTTRLFYFKNFSAVGD